MAETLGNKLKDSLGVLYYSTALRIIAHRVYTQIALSGGKQR